MRMMKNLMIEPVWKLWRVLILRCKGQEWEFSAGRVGSEMKTVSLQCYYVEYNNLITTGLSQTGISVR